MGSSCGGNIAFFAGLRNTNCPSSAAVRGLVLHQPYLGGVERTPSEARSGDDAMLPLEANDKLWHLALPEGANRNHEFCNPAKAMVAAVPRHGEPRRPADRQAEGVRAVAGGGRRCGCRRQGRPRGVPRVGALLAGEGTGALGRRAQVPSNRRWRV
ncbi:unnamed protein product, partial [Urochloa humidicola]